MKRVTGVVVGALALCVLVGNSLQAGSKDGKTRWSVKKTADNCKWLPAIKVPAAQGTTPGKVTLKITYKAKELAEFFVIGDGDTDLDLFVFDSEGKEVAKDEDLPAEKGGGSDLCMCRWRPKVEQEYTIVIVNLGKVYNMARAGCN